MSARRARAKYAFGALFVFGLSFAIAYPLWWTHRSSTVGSALISRTLQQQATTNTLACQGSGTSALAPAQGTAGVLEIPSIGLVAPVLQGLDDNVLNVAVGHVPTTPWPGAPGESMVLAHDVSYFARLDQLRPGATIIWQTDCVRVQFQVDGTSIKAPGDLVYAAPGGTGLALVTCYPTDALFWTTQRYVVTTHLVSEDVSSQQLPGVPSGDLPAMSVNAPAPLLSQGLGLDTNQLHLGRLSINGTPSESFAQGPGPLQVEKDALEVYFGAKKSVEQRQSGWWQGLVAPGLAMPAAWPAFGAIDVTITMDGDQPISVSLTSPNASASIVLRDSIWQLAALGS